MQNKIARYELVELLVPAGAGNRVSFTDIPQLRTQEDQEIFVNNIEIFLASVYANSQTNNSVAGLPATELDKAVLCLYVMGEERIHFIPLVKMNTINDGTNPFNNVAMELDSLAKIDWAKSYVQFSTVPASTPYVIPFGVTYIKVLRQQ